MSRTMLICLQIMFLKITSPVSSIFAILCDEHLWSLILLSVMKQMIGNKRKCFFFCNWFPSVCHTMNGIVFKKFICKETEGFYPSQTYRFLMFIRFLTNNNSLNWINVSLYVQEKSSYIIKLDYVKYNICVS